MMIEFKSGDTVRYSTGFCKSIGNYTCGEEGEYAEITGISGRVARLEWCDGSETTALLFNLQSAIPFVPESTYDSSHHEKLLEDRAVLLLDAAIEVRRAWGDGEPEFATR